MNNDLVAQLDSINVRKTAHQGKWWFSALDLVKVLTNTKQEKRYWNEFKNSPNSSSLQSLGKIEQLKLKAADGKNYKTDCLDYDAAIRLIEIIPSEKALPLQKWMHSVIKERIEEMNNPELAISRGQDRAREYYIRKGYSPEWIKERIEGISSARNPLTEEWKERGIKSGQDYAKLTNINHVGTFGINVSAHKSKKELLKKESLRDNMMPIELSFCSWAERFQTEALRKENPTTPEEVEKITSKMGQAISEMRKTAENYLGKSIATSEKPKKEKINERKNIRNDSKRLA